MGTCSEEALRVMRSWSCGHSLPAGDQAAHFAGDSSGHLLPFFTSHACAAIGGSTCLQLPSSVLASLLALQEPVSTIAMAKGAA